jgi:hypothetical protein
VAVAAPDYDELRALLALAPEGPYAVVERSSPGHRVELPSGEAVEYGPEPPRRAHAARFLAEARSRVPGLLDERDALEAERDSLVALGREREDEMARLRSALEDVLEGLLDHALPDWFQGRVMAALDRRGVPVTDTSAGRAAEALDLPAVPS